VTSSDFDAPTATTISAQALLSAGVFPFLDLFVFDLLTSSLAFALADGIRFLRVFISFVRMRAMGCDMRCRWVVLLLRLVMLLLVLAMLRSRVVLLSVCLG